jgi:GTPase Era involved in 16S rRNA processing
VSTRGAVTSPGRRILQATSDHAAAVCDAARERGARRLAGELDRAAARTPRTATVAVVGFRSRGKSTLINALLDAPGLVPTEVDVTTNAHIVIGPPEPGERSDRYARVHFVDGRTIDVSVEELDAYGSEVFNENNEKGVHRIDVFVRHPLLEAGLRLLDTPGVGGLLSPHGRKTREAVGGADGLLMVLEAGQPMIEEEIEFISQVSAKVQRVVFAHNRADKADDVEEIVRFNRDALERHAPRLARAPIVPVSARQAEQSIRESDDPEYAAELREESRIGPLADTLTATMLDDVLREQAAGVLVQTGTALVEIVRPDQEILEIVDGSFDVTSRVELAQQELRELRADDPQSELREQLDALAGRIAADFENALEELHENLMATVETRWVDELAQTLPETLQNEVDALWGEATNRLSHEGSKRAGRKFAAYGLAEVDISTTAGELDPRGEADKSIPGPPDSPGGLRQRIGRAGEVLTAVGAWLASAVPFVVPVAVIGFTIYENLQERRIGAQEEARRFLDRRITSVGKRFQRRFRGQVDDLYDGIWAELEPRYEARIEGVEAALVRLRELSRRAADPEAAHARLAELEALRERQRQLEAEAGHREAA